MIASYEAIDALNEKLASQKEDYASVAQRYKSDRDSLAKQSSTLRAEIEVLKRPIPAAPSDELKKTQLELQNAKRQIEKLERTKRDLEPTVKYGMGSGKYKAVNRWKRARKGLLHKEQ